MVIPEVQEGFDGSLPELCCVFPFVSNICRNIFVATVFVLSNGLECFSFCGSGSIARGGICKEYMGLYSRILSVK